MLPAKTSRRRHTQVKANQIVLLDYNDAVGPVRIRQLRVRNNTCLMHVANKGACYGKYSESNEETQAMGMEPWHQWQSAYELQGRSYPSKQFEYVYGGGGFAVDLHPSNATKVEALLERLQACS